MSFELDLKGTITLGSDGSLEIHSAGQVHRVFELLRPLDGMKCRFKAEESQGRTLVTIEVGEPLKEEPPAPTPEEEPKPKERAVRGKPRLELAQPRDERSDDYLKSLGVKHAGHD